MGRWRRHKREFKRQAVERMKVCDNITGLARELDIEQRLLYTWKSQFEGRPEPRHASYVETPEETTERKTASGDCAAEAGVGRPGTGNRFFQGCLAQNRGRTPEEIQLWRSGVYAEIRQQANAQGRLTVEKMCCLASVSRASYYRQLAEKDPEREEVETRAAIQEIALAQPAPLRIPPRHRGTASPGFRGQP